MAATSPRDALELTTRLLEQGHGVSVDLFGERVQRSAEATAGGDCPRAARSSEAQVGAEEAALTGAVLRCVLAVVDDGLADRLGATVRANRRRSVHDAAAPGRGCSDGVDALERRVCRSDAVADYQAASR
jgi:proline dehydrogenase